jgi:hypothetical protein
MRVKIENHRGFEISFDPEDEKFWYLSEKYDTESSSKSFAAIKKAIDDFIKENKEFKPFWIENSLSYLYGDKKLKVVGIRKDGAFIVENERKEKKQLSKHSEGGYILYNEANDKIRLDIAELESKLFELQKEIKEMRLKQVGMPLEEYKKQLI